MLDVVSKANQKRHFYNTRRKKTRKTVKNYNNNKGNRGLVGVVKIGLVRCGQRWLPRAPLN